MPVIDASVMGEEHARVWGKKVRMGEDIVPGGGEGEFKRALFVREIFCLFCFFFEGEIGKSMSFEIEEYGRLFCDFCF